MNLRSKLGFDLGKALYAKGFRAKQHQNGECLLLFVLTWK
jgi:hypothetical protein